MGIDSIETASVEEEFTAVVYGDVDRADLAEWVPDALRTVEAYLQRWGAGPKGEPFVRVVDGEVEAGFTATTPVGGEGDVEPSELPAGDVATLVVDGPEVEAGFTALADWVTAKGVTPAGDPWEVLLDGTIDGRRRLVQPIRTA